MLSQFSQWKKYILAFVSTIMAFFQSFAVPYSAFSVNLAKNVSYDFSYATEKVSETGRIGNDETFTMHLAKNESEACQITFRSTSESFTASLELDNFVNASGDILNAKLYTVSYVKWGETRFEKTTIADPVVPYNGENISINEDVNVTFYIEVKSEKDTPQGIYNARLKLIRSGETVVETTVSAEVWNFALPDKQATAVSAGLYGSAFYYLNVVDPSSYGHTTVSNTVKMTDAQQAVYKQYYDLLLEHGISAFLLPYDIMTEEAEAYMDNPDVTSFCIPYSTDDLTLKEYYYKVNQKQEWADKAYFYPIEEPLSAENEDQYIMVTDRLLRLCPGCKIVTPSTTEDISTRRKTDTVESIDIQICRNKILCPESSTYYRNNTFYNEMINRSIIGDDIWWHTGNKTEDDFCNFFINQSGLSHRILFWQQNYYQVSGLLIRNAVSWELSGNPWENSKTGESYDTAGENSLVYPGYTIGKSEPIASIRLKAIANGIEDYTYLNMAKEIYGTNAVNEVINEVTTSMTDYISSDEVFEEVRIELAKMLSAN